MAETATRDGQVTWLKQKYKMPKTRGGYKSGSSTSGKHAVKRKKVGGGPGPVEHVKVITADGRVRWETRARETRR